MYYLRAAALEARFWSTYVNFKQSSVTRVRKFTAK